MASWKPKPGEKIRHGTNRSYNVFRCRCKWCRMAHRAYHGADMAERTGRELRLVGPEALTERTSLDLSADELALWTDRARLAGLSRQAYIRRCMKEVIEIELANERNRARELATPLLEIGG